MDIPGYDRAEEVVRLGPYAVLRAQRGWDHRAVLVKTLVDTASRFDNDALEREGELLRDLTIPGAPGIYDLGHYNGIA